MIWQRCVALEGNKVCESTNDDPTPHSESDGPATEGIKANGQDAQAESYRPVSREAAEHRRLIDGTKCRLPMPMTPGATDKHRPVIELPGHKC